MIPVVLGVFTTHSTHTVGAETTLHERATAIHWFIARSPGGDYLTQPLNDHGMPSGFLKAVSEEEFLTGFVFDSGEPQRAVREACLRLRLLLGGVACANDFPELPPEEAMVRDGLMTLLHGKAGRCVEQNDLEAMQVMLADMADQQEMMLEYQRIVTSAAIGLRKQHCYAQAAAYYRKALTVAGQNDHILFNLARVYFETGKLPEAREALHQALELNPELEMARRFLRYLDASRENAE